MTNVLKTAGFDLPHLDEGGKLGGMLSSALKSKCGKEAIFSKPLSYDYWDASYFNLENVKIFQEAIQEEKEGILQLANKSLLEEAYFVEKAGVGYMAKMVLLAETTEERMLYGLFTANETTHLAQISRFLPEKQFVGTDNSFLRFLGDLIETQDKAMLLFVIQVVLEGWGLSHYRSLAKRCREPFLGEMFLGFLQDEARHHSTGVTLFSQRDVSKETHEAIAQILTSFFRMVQVGPQAVVSAIEKVKGHLSRQQKIKIFEELETETHSGSRLNLLRSLMQHSNAGTLVEELEAQGTFEPFPASRCV